jgi:hypothetical protein
MQKARSCAQKLKRLQSIGMSQFNRKPTQPANLNHHQYTLANDIQAFLTFATTQLPMRRETAVLGNEGMWLQVDRK